ncbi:hypothetical protein [Sediminibacter sp. Hel_I_10]|uniref:hypothetical protein n=1 Tax=Sediminibacter sp. Hel_I_10 TaxID=1392490 RepID=UPI00047E51C7|nr:hypothetical protein [Sediminibacter sp. Hel_I_10]
MKNILVLILGFLLGCLAMYLICCKNDDDDGMLPTTPPAPSGLITPRDAMTLDQAYDPRYQLISSTIVTRPGGDNRSVWFSTEEIKSFLDYADHQASNLNYTMNGIRIYLGAYPDDPTGEGYTTMFMVPTGYANTADTDGAEEDQLRRPNNDIIGADGLNHGGSGMPPSANYPQ